VARTLGELAYESSLRRLDKQEQSLAETRSRTGLLLAASPIAVSFLGRPVLDPDPLLLLLALAAFATNIAAGLYVLLPTHSLAFALVGSQLFDTLSELNDVEEVHKRLAKRSRRVLGGERPGAPAGRIQFSRCCLGIGVGNRAVARFRRR
jgi:hypothetical protein